MSQKSTNVRWENEVKDRWKEVLEAKIVPDDDHEMDGSQSGTQRMSFLTHGTSYCELGACTQLHYGQYWVCTLAPNYFYNHEKRKR